MEEEHNEPDSQQDGIDECEPEGLFDEILEECPGHEPSLSDSRVTQDSQSVESEASVNSPLIFKKMPELNRIFKKQTQKSTLCVPCGIIIKTVEISRLVPHVKKCKRIDKGLKSEIVAAYERKGKRKTRDDTLNDLWMMFMIENNVPLKCVDSQSFKRFKAEAVEEWLCADRHKFSNYYLPAISNIIRDGLATIVQRNMNSLTVEFDHWTDINKRSFLGIVFTFSSGKRYLLDLIDVSLDGHASRVTVKHLFDALSDIPTRSINSIMSDSASACKLARELFVENPEYKRVIQHRCIAHLVNRMGTLFCEDEHIRDSMAWASAVTNSLSKSTRLVALLNEIGQNRPKRACAVRWYSNVNMAETLLEAREPLTNLMREFPESTRFMWVNDEEHWYSLRIAQKVLRPLADCIAVAERNIGSLGEAVRSLLLYAKDMFGRDWVEPLTVGAISSFLTYFGPNKLGREEFGLLLAAYTLDRRNKCDFITEDGLELVLESVTDIAIKNGCNDEDIKSVMTEYNDFCNQRGLYSRGQPMGQSASEWWNEFQTCSQFRLIATRIASLRSSSANIERTFSSLKYYQGAHKTNASVETLVHMTRVRIFEGYDDESEPTGADSPAEVRPESQQVTGDGLTAGATGSEKTVEGTQSVEANEEMPILLTPGMQEIYEIFKRYVDFSKINCLTIEIPESQPELSSEKLENIREEYRRLRNRATTPVVELTDSQPTQGAQAPDACCSSRAQ